MVLTKETKEKKAVEFKRDYYVGIGVGLLSTAVAQAFGNKWPILMVIGLTFVFYGIYSWKRKDAS